MSINKFEGKPLEKYGVSCQIHFFFFPDTFIMIRKVLLSLGAAFMAGSAMAQFCGTDEVAKEYQAKYPGIAQEQARLDAEIMNQIRNMDLTHLAAKGTNDTDTSVMVIPVVVHVMHDYGQEYVSDDQIYTMIREMNLLYSAQNASLSTVITPFIPYIGNAHIRFALATKDPQGNPSHGITRRRTYLTLGGDDQAKMDYWPQNSYLNIWLINRIGRGTTSGIVAAYSAFPSSATSQPYYDGIIGNYQFINNSASSNNTYGHEVGHSFNLYHPWNSSGQGVGAACGDDQVLDTPPTKGHFGACDLYDVACAVGNPNGPDTTNTQNVMDYADCASMFTKGQVERMRATLRSSVGGRNNLWAAANLTATGANAPRPVMPPIADFSVNRVFYCGGTGVSNFTFTNRSWNDTVTSASWTFSNSATFPTSTTTTSIPNGFTTPGWATVTLNVTGLHGTSSVTKTPIYVADQATINPAGYSQEFTAGNDADKYPMFDYYNTGRKWELATTGYNDNASARYVNKDTRTSANYGLNSGTPDGDFSDFFTPAFDLSGAAYTTNCKLNFMSAGAYRTAATNAQRDVLEVSYSVNCGLSWFPMDSITGSNLANNSATTTDFVPQSASQWVSRSIDVPAAARKPRTFFRFRYKSESVSGGVGVGNNFYLDRFSLTGLPTGVNGVELNATGMEIAPNPTSGAAFIMLKGAGNGTAYVQITDITGKNVYMTQAEITGDLSRIDIPASNIYAKGMYLVKVIAGTKTFTRKLVVE